MEFSAQQIADILEGTVDGNPGELVTNLSSIQDGVPGTLSFLANPKYSEYIYSTGASIVIVNNNFEPEKSLPDTLTLIRVEDSYKSFSEILSAYEQMKPTKKGISKNAEVHDSVNVGGSVFIASSCFVGENTDIGDEVHIDFGCYIGDNVTLGKGTKLFPGVKILEGSVIGSYCTFQAGVIIGGDGFGFAPNVEGDYSKIPQIGNVIIEDHVDVGANTTIDRATFGSTIIRKGVKMDNLIQIGHNTEIGDNTVIVSQTGIAGSTKIGKNCMIGGQVGIVGHIEIADGVKIAAQSGIGSSIKKEGSVVQGSPAFSILSYKKSYVGFRNLPDLMKKVDSINKKLKDN